jgi:hypothetical protein
LKQQEKIKTEQAAARKALADGAARKALANELCAGRRELQELQSKITKAEEQAIDSVALPNSYPDIPALPRFKPHKEGEGLPETSGAYFLWSYGASALRRDERDGRHRRPKTTCCET